MAGEYEHPNAEEVVVSNEKETIFFFDVASHLKKTLFGFIKYWQMIIYCQMLNMVALR